MHIFKGEDCSGEAIPVETDEAETCTKQQIGKGVSSYYYECDDDLELLEFND